MSNNTDNKRLLVIKASAGSGKTYNLALQYIKHLLFDTDEGTTLVPRRSEDDTRVLNVHRALLAITFTNKATNEMKERIVNELFKLAQPGVKSDYLQGFMDDSGLTEQRVRTMARLALNELLLDYSNFNVSTIDSFFQGVLRNFARELDRDYNYDIQLEEDYAVRVAVHNFLLSLGRTGSLTQVDQWVKEHQRHLIRSDAKTKKWKIFEDGGDIYDVAKQLNKEVFRSRIQDIRDYLGKTDADGRYQSDFTRINRFRKLLKQHVKTLADDLQHNLMALRDELAAHVDELSGNMSLLKWYKKVCEISEPPLPPLTDALAQADEDKIAAQFLKAHRPDEAIIDRLLPLVARHFKLQSQEGFYQHLEDYLGMLGMLAMIDHYLEEYRHESNSILIGDANDLIGVVLESGSEFVYERVGTLIKHFMIDEFQDTSAKQYRNFSTLLAESLGNGHFNMLIGDAKQSIYRFRNADLTVFRERVGEDFGDYMYEPEVEPGAPRSVNYRSSRGIIEFNNQLFAYVRGHCGGNQVVTTTYQDVEQGFSPGIDEKKVPGYVRVLTGNYHQLLQDPVIADAAAQLGVEPQCDEVQVSELLPGYLLQLHERYDWGQIGILVFTHKEGNRLVEAILDYNKRTTGEKINVISGESLLLSNSPIIRRVVAMLRFIDVSQVGSSGEDDPEELPQDGVQRSILKKRLSDQRMYAALNDFIHYVSTHPDDTPEQHGTALASCLDRHPVVPLQAGGDDDRQQPYDDLLARLLPPDSELTTLVSIVETIIGHFKQSGGSDDIDRETAFLLAFQDCVMQFSAQQGGGSVREFLKYWDDNKHKLAVSLPSTTNAVNIMTIHAAKGLEFDCVVIPYADWELADSSQEKEYWMPGEYLADVEDGIKCDPADVPPLLHVSKKSVAELADCGMLQGEALQFYLKQRADVLVENLNKTYVAFTRPRTEMHIFTMPGGKCKAEKPADDADGTKPKRKRKPAAPASPQEPAKDVTSLLAVYCVEHMRPVDGAKGWYEYGEMSSRQEISAHKSSRQDDDAPEQQPLDQYAIRPVSLHISVKVESAPSPVDAGKRLHALLSRVHDVRDLDRVVDEGHRHGIVTDDPNDPCGMAAVQTRVCALIRDHGCPVAAWFDPANKVYSERTITRERSPQEVERRRQRAASQGRPVLQADDTIENLRPDRIVRRPEGQLLVIDYKSGHMNAEEHCRQVQQYIERLSAIFPGVPIAGRIWYTTRGLVLDECGRVLYRLQQA